MCDTGADGRRALVSEYYGETLKNQGDLRTSACCPIDAVPVEQREIVSKLHPEVVSKFYGCGSPIPDTIKGASVLDLGCGTGRDAFVASALVGTEGSVLGIDMTPSQLDVANSYLEYHTKAFLGCCAKPNVEFREGVIEDLEKAKVDAASMDVVISNCVCNLAVDKGVVWQQIHRALTDGGELYFSDVYADRRLSAEARAHPVLIAECLGGAMYIEDFRRTMRDAGFPDIRVVTSGPISVNDPELKGLVEQVSFSSVTARAFKIDGLEDSREDFGQTATYTPAADEESKTELKFDAEFTFPAGVPVPVDGNTALILKQSRYGKLFTVTERGVHLGSFKAEEKFGLANCIWDQPPPSENKCGNGTAKAQANGTAAASKCC